MNKLYMGIDAGSMYIKGVIIDEYNNIIASKYVETQGNPIKSVKKAISSMQKEIDFDMNEVVSVGVTGSAKRLVGTLIDADIIKDETSAEVAAVKGLKSNIKTVLSIGSEHAKLITIDGDKTSSMISKPSCLIQTGSFLSSFVKKMGIRIEDVNELCNKSKSKIKISEKCSVFLEEELTNKINRGYKLEDILAAVARTIAKNYYLNIAGTKNIASPIMAIGGVTKNNLVVLELERLVGEKIITDKNSQMMGAIGVGILARESKIEKIFNFDIDEFSIDTKMINCCKCVNNCNMVVVYKNNKLVDSWGYKCENGITIK